MVFKGYRRGGPVKEAPEGGVPAIMGEGREFFVPKGQDAAKLVTDYITGSSVEVIFGGERTWFHARKE